LDFIYAGKIGFNLHLIFEESKKKEKEISNKVKNYQNQQYMDKKLRQKNS
jgi:hypothetical protein